MLFVLITPAAVFELAYLKPVATIDGNLGTTVFPLE